MNFIRPNYKDLKHWCEDPNNVYIGRKGVVFIDKKRFPPDDSIFANPFKIGKDNNTRDDVIAEYRKYIVDKIENGQISENELLNLKGKRLGCWCKPEVCHGDILLQILDEKVLREI